MTKHEYNTLQWLIPALRGNWRQQTCDAPDRAVDTTKVTKTRKPDWTDSPNANDTIRMPRPWRAGDNDRGRSMQAGHPTKRVKFHIRNTYSGQDYTAMIPAPLRGDGYWVEGNPRPLWNMATANGIYDCHIIIVLDQPDAEGWQVYELIGATHWGAWRALSLARWDTNGNLHPDDRPVTWGGHQMSRLILNRGDQPHRLALTLKGRDEDPPTFPWRNQWLALRPDRIPEGLNRAEEWLAHMLCAHGVLIQDHGGHTGLSIADGHQWAGTDFSRLQASIRLTDFEQVIR